MSENFLGKKYILKCSKNFDSYMKELGVGLILRKMGNTVKTECILTKRDDNMYEFVLESPYRCSCIIFQLGKEFKELTLDNRKVRTVCHLNGNIFVQRQAGHGLKATTIVREYRDDELLVTLTVGDVKAIRYYVALEETHNENV